MKRADGIGVTALVGDVTEILPTLDGAGFDACLCDPPYGLSFMGKAWDHGVPGAETWALVLAALKPGAPLLAFGGTRTHHRLMVAIEDAGFEIRDCLMFLHGQGFPKSHNFGCRCEAENGRNQLRGVRVSVPGVSEDVAEGEGADLLPTMRGKDALQGNAPLSCVRESEGNAAAGGGSHGSGQLCMEGRGDVQAAEGELHRSALRPVSAGVPGDGEGGRLRDGAPAGDGKDGRTAPLADGGGSPPEPQPTRQPTGKSGAVRVQRRAQARGSRCETCGGVVGFEGYGTALKPAFEPIVLAMKPIDGTFAQSALAHGVAGLNVDGCRISGAKPATTRGAGGSNGRYSPIAPQGRVEDDGHGRWPANVVLSHLPECREIGTRRVASTNFGGHPSGRKNSVLGSDSRPRPAAGFADADGTETVPAWECVEGCPVRMLDEQSGFLHAPGFVSPSPVPPGKYQSNSMGLGVGNNRTPFDYPDGGGGASRFFYTAKASRSEREAGLREAVGGAMRGEETRPDRPTNHPVVRNHHPTVKPIDLCRWLATLILPPARETPRRLLVPFSGSGSEMIGARLAGWDDVVGIELSPEYAAIAEARIAELTRQKVLA
jgi:hypothetical protein